MKARLTATLVKSLQPKSTPYEIRDTEITGFLLRVQPSGVMTYYLDYRTKTGRRARYRIGRNVTPRQARDAAEQAAADVVKGKDPHAEKKEARRREEQRRFSKLGGFLKHKYGPWVTQQRKTGSETLRRLRANFGELMERSLEDITLWSVEKWRAKQKANGKAPSTINRDVTALKAALSKAVEWSLIETHPLAQLKPLTTDKCPIVRFLTDEEEQRLRAALDAREARICAERDSANAWRQARGYPRRPRLHGQFVDHLKPMVLLSINTGLRRGELFDLTWSNVRLEEGYLTVHGHKAKSGQTRHVPLNEESRGVLDTWRTQSPGDGYVFPGRDGERLDNVKKAWQSLRKAAGLLDFRWHDMRHHFASKLAMRGVDLNTVRELLGHRDIKMTLRYAHLAQEHKAEAVSRLSSHVA